MEHRQLRSITPERCIKAAKEIASIDQAYNNRENNEPNYIRIYEDGIMLINMFKTGSIRGVLMGFDGNKPTDKEIQLIQKILRKNGEKQIFDKKYAKSD